MGIVDITKLMRKTASSETRVFLVIGDLANQASGPNALVARLAAWLVRNGYDVTVVGTWRRRRPSHSNLSALYGNSRILIYRRFFKDSWHFAPGTIGLAVKLLTTRNPFVVDVHSLWMFNGIVLGLVAQIRKCRNFVKLAGSLRPLALNKSSTAKKFALKIFFKHWLYRVSAIMVLNEREKEEAEYYLPKASFSIVANGVNPHPDALKSVRSKELLFLGRINPVKNLEGLVDAFSMAAEEFPGWILRIVGPAEDPQYLQNLKSRICALKQADKIILDSAVYGVEKEFALLSASFFALTSWSEGQPNAVLEAMAHGLPVVISDQCNLEIPSDCGVVCGCSAEEIAEALRKLLGMSQNEMRDMRTRALNFVETSYTEEKVFKQRVDLYFQ